MSKEQEEKKRRTEEKIKTITADLRGVGGDTKEEALANAKKVLEKHGFIWEWGEDASYAALCRSMGAQYVIDILNQIHDQVPLSLKGFEETRTPREVKWRREIGGKTVTLHIAGADSDMKPATGDVAKRVLLGICRFARHRKTTEPGPIKFGELLDLLGMPRCSQDERKAVRNYCDSFSLSGMVIERRDEKGKRIYRKAAPFFKGFEWIGDLEQNARIYPVFNEMLGKLLIEENLIQYVWLDDDRLKPLPKGMTKRDRLAQDQFRMLVGLPVSRFIMKNWLFKFGQFTEEKLLKKMPLKEIRKFVNFNFMLAKESNLINSYRIRAFQKKRRYLQQMIWIYPARPEQPRMLFPDDPEIKELVDAIVYWAYDPENKFYVKMSEEETRGQLQNYIIAHGMEIVLVKFKEAMDMDIEEQWTPEGYGEGIYQPGSVYMWFWNELKGYAEANRKKGRPS